MKKQIYKILLVTVHNMNSCEQKYIIRETNTNNVIFDVFSVAFNVFFIFIYVCFQAARTHRHTYMSRKK